MNGISATSTPTTDVEELINQKEVNVFLSQSQVPGHFSRYPTITIEEVKAFLEDEATTRNVKLLKQSKRNSKVMKFKFLEGKDSESGTPQLITAIEDPGNKLDSEPEVSESISTTEKLDTKEDQESEIRVPVTRVEELECKKDSKPGTRELITGAEEQDKKKDPESGCTNKTTPTEKPDNKVDQTDSNPRQYQTDINLSLSKSLVPMNYSKYPRITVTTKPERKKVRKKKNPKTLVNPARISVRDLRTTISEMSSKQLNSLLNPLAPEKLQSIQNSLSKILEVKNREIIAAKQAQIEKLRQEIESL